MSLIEDNLLTLFLSIDLLSISDRDTWAYGEALRAMAQRNHFIHIAFSRLGDLVNFPMPENLQEITYVANATNFRRCLLNTYGRDKIDIDKEISTSPDTLMTYRGYRRFLESDLQHIFPTGNGRSSKGYKRDVKYLAKQMLIRGYVSLIFSIVSSRGLVQNNTVSKRPN